MESTSKSDRLSDRDIFYFRQRYQNRIFQAVAAYFAGQAEHHGINKRNIALRLGKEPSQITRWLSGPGNWTLDTVSDLLLAMDAEMSAAIEPFSTVPVNKTASRADHTTIKYISANTGTSRLEHYA